jgi:ankyrin repeat protein
MQTRFSLVPCALGLFLSACGGSSNAAPANSGGVMNPAPGASVVGQTPKCPAPSAAALAAFTAIENPVGSDLESTLDANPVSATDRNERCETLYFDAIRSQNDGARAYLETHGLSPVASDVDPVLKDSAIGYALAHGDVPTIQSYVEKDTSDFKRMDFLGYYTNPLVPIVTSNSKTVLDWALTNYRLSLTLENSSDSTTFLDLAIQNQRPLGMIELLVKSGAATEYPVQSYDADDYFESPLQTAARVGYRDALAYLIRSGAYTERGGDKTRKAIFLAVDLDRADLIATLAEAGANLNPLEPSSDSSGFITPLEYANEHGKSNAAAALVKYGATATKEPTWYAVKCANPQPAVQHVFDVIEGRASGDVTALLADHAIAKTAPNARCEPLYVAAIRANNLAAVDALEKAGYGFAINEPITDLIGVRPEKSIIFKHADLFSAPGDYAIRYGTLATIQSFEKRTGSSLGVSEANSLDFAINGPTETLALAITYNPNDLSAYFLKSYVCDNDCDRKNAGLLYRAVNANRIDWATSFIAAGVDVNATNDVNVWEAYPLMPAADHGSLEIVKILLDHGAKKDVKSAYQETPYEIALRKNRPQAILDLLKP